MLSLTALTELRTRRLIIRTITASPQAKGLVAIKAKRSFSLSWTTTEATSALSESRISGILWSGRTTATINPSRISQGATGRYAISARLVREARTIGSTLGSPAQRSASQPTRIRNSWVAFIILRRSSPYTITAPMTPAILKRTGSVIALVSDSSRRTFPGLISSSLCQAFKPAGFLKSPRSSGEQQPENQTDYSENQHEFPCVLSGELDDREADVRPCRSVRLRHCFARIGQRRESLSDDDAWCCNGVCRDTHDFPVHAHPDDF